MPEQELELEFEEYVKLINQKLQEAAQALREVKELTKKANLPSLVNHEFLGLDDEEYEALEEKLQEIDKIREFENAMDDLGWSSSSSYC